MKTEEMTIKAKLSAIQAELKAPKSQYNSFGKYSYRSCEDILQAVKPLCVKYNAVLTISDTVELIGSRFYIKATVTLRDLDSEAEITSVAFAREDETKKSMDGAQITGAASSYARKYALNGLFSIDDTKDSDTNEFHNQNKKDTKEYICPECGKKIEALTLKSGKVMPASEVHQKYGKCSECLKKEKDKEKAKAKIEGATEE